MSCKPTCHSKHAVKMICEEISGKISHKVNYYPLTIWKAVGVFPSGTLKIVNKSDCAMKVRIKRANDLPSSKITVLPKTEKFVTVTCMVCIEVACLGYREDDICTGSFCLLLHYPSKIPLSSDCCAYDKELWWNDVC